MNQRDTLVAAGDANTLYRRALTALVDLPSSASPRGMATRELLGACIRLEDASRCLVTWAARRLNYHFAVAEWWWIATGRGDVASIAPYCSEITKYSDDGATFFGNYGTPWTAQSGYVLAKLREDPDSRQAVATIWRQCPPATRDVPCTVAMQYLAREGALHAVVTMRSWDAYLGFCYDVFNFARLQASLAGELGLHVGSLQVNAGSFHVYERDRAKALALLDERWPAVAPQLDPLPGLVPASLARQDMAVPMRVEDWTRDGAWEPYLAAMRHRFSRDENLTRPWSEVLV